MSGRNRQDEFDGPPANDDFPGRSLGIMFVVVLVLSLLAVSAESIHLVLAPPLFGVLFVLSLAADQISKDRYLEAAGVFFLGSLACLIAAGIGVVTLFTCCFNGFW